MKDPPDLIILDLQMPVMDGFAVLEKLKESSPTDNIPVIVISANAVERVKNRVLDAGANFFLEKPYEAKKLMSIVDGLVGRDSAKGI